MSFFSQFAISLGASLALQAIIIGWLFRTSAAPLWHKLFIPALVVAFACWTPFSVASLLGYPVPTSMAQLPQEAQLIAFVPHDDARIVDLWLIADKDTPRAFETALTGEMKKTLEQAREAMEHGQRAMLTKHGKGKQDKASAGDPLGIGDDIMYVLNPDAITQLPSK